MREELFEEILSLVEEFINEVSVKRWKEAALNSIDSREGNRLGHAKEVASLPNSGRSANNVVRAAKNSAEKREEKRRKEYRRKQVSVPFGYRDVPDDNTAMNTKRTDRAYELATTNNKNAKELYGDYVDEAFSLVEEYINELDLSTMQSSNDKRKENWENSLDDYLKASKEGDENKKEEENLKSLKARNKFYKNSELTKKRIAQKVADFKEKLINKKPQTFKQTQQAGSDHDNAMIDQYRRNKLEKAFSNECLEEITSLIRESLEEITKKNLEETPIGSKEWYKAMSQAVRATTAKTKVRLQRREEGKPALDERPKAERKQATSDYLRRK